MRRAKKIKKIFVNMQLNPNPARLIDNKRFPETIKPVPRLMRRKERVNGKVKISLKLAVRHLSVRPFAGDAFGSDITVSPIRVGQACDADAFAAGRICEFAVAYIKSHV